VNKTVCCFFVLMAGSGFGQVLVPEGTKVRVRLEQNISSATAEQGETVELSVTDAVKVGNVVVFPEGARVTGTITEAQEKRRMGRAGKLDFSIDRAKGSDDQWVPLRYTVNKKSGESHAVSTGVMTAGAALVFWPAAPVFLLRKGKDITINKGVSFDVFTDTNHVVGGGAAGPSLLASAATAGAPVGQQPGGMATVAVTCPVAGADIEVDGAFMGNTPTTLQLPAGQRKVVVKSGAKSWQRTVQVNAGSTVSLNAALQ
jgi:hypothetical protein